MSEVCPAAAQAWSVGMSLGRSEKPRIERPTAAAPLETSTTRSPRCLSSQICAQSERTKDRSSSLFSHMRVDDPTLATMSLLIGLASLRGTVTLGAVGRVRGLAP